MSSEPPQTYRVRPVTVSASIPADAATVFTFVSDTRNDPSWCSNVTRVRQTAGDEVEVGSAFEFHQSVEAGGRNLESDVTVEVVELSEREIRWRVEDRFQIRDVVLSVEPADGGSSVTQTTTAVFKHKPGLVKWLYPMLAKRTFKDQFRGLTEHFT